ncbi:DUF4148 domain-containing protein [Paraburkholderia xenovorans]|uniref:DUF4148 domain-containing protein n=1 Tax=Paraburkholderia xenovorans TaxID=36873 RepID=UPI0038BBEB4C
MHAFVRYSLMIVAVSLSASALAQQAPATGKSRADVRQELVQAQHDGVIPTPKTRYPADDQTIQRNQELHAITTHGNEKSPAMDHHDTAAAR